MAKQHPHVDAEYFIAAQADASYGIRVVIPEQQPTFVTGFASRQDAEAWVERHRERVLAGPQGRTPFKWAR